MGGSLEPLLGSCNEEAFKLFLTASERDFDQLLDVKSVPTFFWWCIYYTWIIFSSRISSYQYDSEFTSPSTQKSAKLSQIL